MKGYRADIAARRHGLITEQQRLHATRDMIGQSVNHVEALMGYCERVRQRLRTFNAAEQRLAFDALNVQVRWTPGEPLRIEGSIPLGDIAPVSLQKDR